MDVNHNETNKEKVQKVNAAVCKHFGIEESQLYASGRTKKVSAARSFALYILHRDMGLTILSLSLEYKRTSRTVYWHCEQTARYIRMYRDCKKDYEDICEIIKKS